MRIVLIIVGLVLLVAIGVVVYVAQNANTLVQNAIETLGSDYLGTTVSVGSVDISLSEGSGSVKGLQIANPAGYDGPYLMQLDEIAVRIDLQSLGGEAIVLDGVTIDGARIAAVVKTQKDSNLQALLDNLEANTAGAEETPAESGAGTKVIIDQLDFTNAQASVNAVLVGKEYEVDVPNVHLRDVGRKTNGATAGEVAQQLLKPVMEAILREVVKRGVGIDQEEIKGKLLDKIPGFGRSG